MSKRPACWDVSTATADDDWAYAKRWLRLEVHRITNRDENSSISLRISVLG